MALLHADFPSGQAGLYGTGDQPSFTLDGMYAQFQGEIETDPDGVSGGNVVSYQHDSINTTVPWRWVMPAAHATVGVAARFWNSNIPDGVSTDYLIRWNDAGNSTVAQLFVTATGALSMQIIGGSTYTTTGPVIVAGAWQHVEVKYTHGAGALCSFEVRVEGVNVLNQTNVAGTNADIAQLASQRDNTSNNNLPRMKDLVIWDGSGSSNNNFMGSVQVRELLPSSDVSFNWTASTGTTGWNLMDEAPPNDNTDYIYAVDPPPAASLFGLTDLPADVTSVKGLKVVVRSTKSDGGDGSLQVGLKSGASTGLGANRAITTTYTYWSDVFELDPATSAEWLPAAVNAVQLQLNRTV